MQTYKELITFKIVNFQFDLNHHHSNLLFLIPPHDVTNITVDQNK
jgi:hypothetical protein